MHDTYLFTLLTNKAGIVGTNVSLMSLPSFPLQLLSCFCWVNQFTHSQTWAKEVRCSKKKITQSFTSYKSLKNCWILQMRTSIQGCLSSTAVNNYLHVHSVIFLFTAFWICITHDLIWLCTYLYLFLHHMSFCRYTRLEVYKADRGTCPLGLCDLRHTLLHWTLVTSVGRRSFGEDLSSFCPVGIT